MNPLSGGQVGAEPCRERRDCFLAAVVLAGWARSRCSAGTSKELLEIPQPFSIPIPLTTRRARLHVFRLLDALMCLALPSDDSRGSGVTSQRD